MAACLLGLTGLAACGLGPAPQPRAGDPRLDAMFATLKAAPSAQAAAPIEAQIWAALRRVESPTVEVLVSRAEAAQAAGRADLAALYLDEAVALAPDVAELYNRRAVLAFEAEDFEDALLNIDETLRREPRHFGAHLGLGAIYERLGKEPAALKAYQQALAIHPHLEPAKQGVARLAPKVDGEDI